MKLRLDQAVFARGLTRSRSEAESWIKLGNVTVDGQAVTKSGYFVDETATIELKTAQRYVSRAGLKLASVAGGFGVDFAGKTVLDVGSSTGGFTDYALQHGAAKVIAVDVGTDQLHPSLLGDPRIELHEKTDIRDVRAKTGQMEDGRWKMANRKMQETNNSPSDAIRHLPIATFQMPPRGSRVGSEESATPAASDPEASSEIMPNSNSHLPIAISPPDIIVIDVSFISLREILPHIHTLMGKKSVVLAMLKPQFEAGRAQVNKGVIKNDSVRRQILRDFEAWTKKYFVILDKADSDVAGAKGNQERFYYMKRVDC